MWNEGFIRHCLWRGEVHLQGYFLDYRCSYRPAYRQLSRLIYNFISADFQSITSEILPFGGKYSRSMDMFFGICPKGYLCHLTNQYILMAKINLLLIQSINGSIDDSVNDSLWSQAPSAADAKKFIKLAAQELTEEYLLSSLINDDSDDIFLLEVHSESATLASILLSLGMVNKVIVYTVPVFVATNHLPFVGLLRDNQLMCEETKVIGSVVRLIYQLGCR